ncbi:U-box domain-containing protein 62-like isoform X2 [Lotus japonicus]|uniref:U-box domain-containing protein 62-like isoform X2 n=1 Tax=Lotus japonicus TaxID=34305 RepID=UPI00258792FD|nr:U-box domain-containing protein 62-like isoform X2 [Lotus japonicus]
MSSDDITLVSGQRIENGLTSPLVFQDDFNPQRNPAPKTRELGGGFIDDKIFTIDRDRDRFFTTPGAEFRRNVYADRPDVRNWRGNGTPSSDETDGDEDDDEDDDDDDDDAEVVRLKGNSNVINDDGVANGKTQHHSPYVSGRDLLGKDGEIGQMGGGGADGDHRRRERLGKSQGSVSVAETDCEEYYSQFLHGTEGSASVQKAMVDDNGCGFSGRKDVMFSTESGESLRAILSDPVTGALMEDAMILPCGHSFGGGGIQHVTRMKACCTCSQPVSEESISPNLSLQAAVQAYRREEESQFYRSSKRRRERLDQGGFGDSPVMESSRSRGVQFPFAVMDRVVIKSK